MATQSLPAIRIENTGAAQTNVPFTFGQVFKVGHLKPGQGLGARMPNGEVISLQVDEKATHADGSVRHAIISGVLPTLNAKAEVELTLVPVKAGTGKEVPFDQFADVSVELLIDGIKYSTSGSILLSATDWLTGLTVKEKQCSLTLVDLKGLPHPHLTIRVGFRAYSTRDIRVEVIVENTKTFAPGARNYTYDVAIEIGGKSVFEQKDLTHYHHARWRKVFWLGQEPQIHVKHDPEYLIGTKAVPNYDMSSIAGESQFESMRKRITSDAFKPMTIGPINPAMPATGGRVEIGPMPSWYAIYVQTANKSAYDVVRWVAEGSGAWSIHYRDENTGYPVRIDNDKNKNISTHMNLGNKGPLPVPRFSNGKATLGTPYQNDTAHQPSFAYLPYLLTGEYYYLEELQFWASSNPLETDPGNRQFDKGLLNWQQVRGQAWSLRTLGHAAYITPDTHPLKDYFVKQVENNIEFYHQTYVEGNPNNLGLYDGSGKASFQVDGSAPWQDDFLTWSFGNLVELGFEKALPILKWKAKYVTGRMTDPGFCWVQASAYFLHNRPSKKEPVFTTFADMYEFNFGGDTILNESKLLKHPEGLKFIDQPCGSLAQSDWLRAASKGHWAPGRMSGFSDSTQGYPANMQPALAMAVQFEAGDAELGWDRFLTRADQPNYKGAPQFNIVPREKEKSGPITPGEEKNSFVIRGLGPAKSGVLELADSRIETGKLYTVVFLEE